MIPDKEGLWEWFDDGGTKRIVLVSDVSPTNDKILRVNWWGGYYSVMSDPEWPTELVAESLWPDRWGNYIGNYLSIPPIQWYTMPTPEQMSKYKKILTSTVKSVTSQHEN